MKYFSDKALDNRIKEIASTVSGYEAGDGIDISSFVISVDSEKYSDWNEAHSAVSNLGDVADGDSRLVNGDTVYDFVMSHLSSVFRPLGITTTPVYDGDSVHTSVLIGGQWHEAVSGDVVTYGSKEFFWNTALTPNQWSEFGDIYALWQQVGSTGVDAQTLELKVHNYVGVKKGLIFEETSEDDYDDSPAHLMLRNLGTPSEPNYALYTPYALITGGDQIVGSGTPGGGGSGASYFSELLDVEFGLSPSVGQILVYAANVPLNPDGTQYGPGWTVANMPTGDVTAISVNGQTYSPSGGVVTLPNYPTIPSTYAWSAITGTPTTLGSDGYGITDAKIENGVITLGSNSITPLTSHQTIYGLTLKVGTSTVGSYTPNSAAQTLTVTAQNLYDTIGSTKYHPYGGDTENNTFKIGGAILTWHPESSAGAGDAYLEIDSALLTLGDQIVGSGTPGGGGGGAGYLYELGDIYHDTDKTKVLRPDGTTPAAVGDVLQLTSLTGGNKWAAVPAADIGRVYSGGTGITIDQNTNTISVTANTYAPYNSAGYLPLSGGVLSANNQWLSPAKLQLMRADATAYTDRACIGVTDGNLHLDSYPNKTIYLNYYSGSTDIRIGGGQGVGAYYMLHTGNVSIANSAITVKSTSLGTSTAPIGWADAILVHSITTEASITQDSLRAYSGSGSTWAGSVASMAYASILAIGSPSRGFQIWASRIGSHANALTWRNGLADASGWAAERVIYDTGNLTKSVLTGLLDASGGYYLHLTGGTISGTTFRPLTVTSSYNGITEIGIGNGTTVYSGFGYSGGYTFIGQEDGGNYPKIAIRHSDGVAIYSPNNFSTNHALYHSGNSNKSDVAWSAASLTLPNLGQIIGANSASLLINGSSGGVTSMWLGDNAMDGITLRTGGAITFNTNSTTRAVISSAGKVGIGTTSPDSKLHIVGAASSWTGHFASNGSEMQVHLCYPNIGMVLTYNSNASTATLLNVRNTVSSTVTSVLYVRGDGNVGIGTSSPGYKLEVSGPTNNWAVRFNGGTANRTYLAGAGGEGMAVQSTLSSSSSYLMSLVYGQTTLGSGGTTAFYVRGDGNVGIGTSSPGQKLDVSGWITFGQVAYNQNTGNGRIGCCDFPYSVTANIGGYGQTEDNRKMCFRVINNAWSVDLFHVSNNGNVGIGTESPGTALHVKGNVSGVVATIENSTNTNAYITFKNTTGTLGHFGCAPSHFLWLNASASVIMHLNNGTLTTTGDQVISSDINLKTHFKDITLTSEQIANAPAVSFDWKDGHGHSFGSIAQYWKPLVPESVLGEEGNYTLAYGQLGTVLGINNGKAIFKLEQHETEQDKEIRKLREKVQKLEEDNLRLKARLNMS